MSAPLQLDNIAPELLIHIFKNLDIKDLQKLRCTCSRFREIIDYLLFPSNPDIVTNDSDILIDRSFRKRSITSFQKHRLHHNWINGIYDERSLLKQRKKCMPRLHLDSENLWISHGSSIKAYKRREDGIKLKPHIILHSKSDYDVCSFVIKDDFLLSGNMYGNFTLWSISNRQCIFDTKNYHLSDVDGVDILGNLIVSGSRDGTVKVSTNLAENVDISVEKIDIGDRVLSVALNKEKHLAVGSAGIHSVPLAVYDIEKLTIRTSLMDGESPLFGSGIMQIKWETPDLIWSCGYDTTVRKWDLRSNECVFKLEDIGLSTVYCFETDFNNTLLTGCQSNGRVVLWDIRKKDFVQIYFMESCRMFNCSSPVYSLSYDPSYLFAATDSHLNILDFTTYKKTGKNYRYR